MTQLAEQFIPVYGPATPFTLPPLFHITLQDAKKLRRDGDADFCCRSTRLRLRASAAGRTDIMVFALPTDEVAIIETLPDRNVQERDGFWCGNSLKPTRWLMEANSWDMFWAKVVTSAWHGFMKGTRGCPLPQPRTREELAAMPVYQAEI